ncbi:MULTISPECIES: DUF982 domain-containing protein [Mesorhizobium]|nr:MULTISPECIES: DUF982 domain-containing protein [Mesorhizobium]
MLVPLHCGGSLTPHTRFTWTETLGTKPCYPRSLWQRWGRPYAETKKPGAYGTLVSVSEAAIFMMDSWPEEHGQRYKAPLQACTGQLTTPEQVEAARQAFLAAAEEAALVVVGAEPAVKATRRPAGDAKRGNQARMERKIC